MQSAHGHMSNWSHGAWLPMVLQISFHNINDSLPASLSPLQHCRPAPSPSHSETMQMKHGRGGTCSMSYCIIYTMKNASSSDIWNHVYMSAMTSTCESREITHLPMWLKCWACHLGSLATSTHTQAPQSRHSSHLGHWGTHQGWVLAHVEWGSTLWVIARVDWHPGHIAQLLHGTSFLFYVFFRLPFGSARLP